jgi:hypothetical protein
MTRHGIRALILGTAATAALAAPLTGCSDNTTPSDAVSQAASAASSLASEAGNALASATAEAGRQFDEFKNGVNAKGDVKVSDVSTDSDGRSTTKVTVTNPTSSSKSYAVQIDFRDQSGGNLLDTAVVTVDDVAAGAAKDATARSNRTLSGEVTAEVARAVRN